MGILKRLFSINDPNFHNKPEKLTFIDCFDIVQTWSARAIVDPDIESDNKALNNALRATVTCPYCKNEIYFGDAVTPKGVQMMIKCPSCGVEPVASRLNEFDLV